MNFNSDLNNYSTSPLRELASIERSFKKGTIHTKKWDAKENRLADLTGWERVEAKVLHFLGLDSKEEQFTHIFQECMFSLNDANIDFNSEKPNKIAKSWKAISHYQKNDTISSKAVSSLALQLENYVKEQREALHPKNGTSLTAEEIIQKREAIEKLYALENKYNDESAKSKSKLREYRKMYEKDLPKQAFEAHKAFTSFLNDKTALQVAKDNIPNFESLAQSKDPKVRSYAVKLFTYVQHGFDAPEITVGSQSPGVFWNIKKIWNTIKWGFSTENREKSVLGNIAEKLDKLPVATQGVVRTLINHRDEMMKDGLIVSYLQILKEKYPQIFTSFFRAENLDPSDFVEKVKENKFFTDPSKDLCFIPFVFKGANRFYPNHIVLVTLDRKAGQIQYYDPQGLPADHPDRLKAFDGFNMSEALDEIRRHWEQIEKKSIEVVTNPIIHQEDTQNCGVYVCDAMECRLAGHDFMQLCLNGKNNEQITSQRDVIAKTIVRDTEEEDRTLIDMIYDEDSESSTEEIE